MQIDNSDWDLKIDTVLLGYRASRQESSKQSQYYMLFQKHMRLPIDSKIMPSEKLQPLNSDNELQETIQALLETRDKLFEKKNL